jgi:hypothetical protein
MRSSVLCDAVFRASRLVCVVLCGAGGVVRLLCARELKKIARARR